MKGPIKKIENNELSLEMSSKIYSIKAITHATYKFTDKCYINITTDQDNIIVHFKPKEDGVLLEEVACDFSNEVIDQQVRIDVENDFKGIREEIVKKAFSPIS